MKISVIVPVFNSAPYLRECIESVLASEGVEIELILIDDGSTDGSGAICDEYDAVVLHTRNRGVAAARNAGIDTAVGDYIAFVDSDDVIESTHFSELLDYAQKNKCDIVMSGLRYFSEDSGISDFYETSPVKQGVYFGRDIEKSIINPMISGGMRNPFKLPATGSTCICLYKTELIKDLKFPPTMISEDLIFQLNALSIAKRVGKLDAFKYCYRIVSGKDSRSRKYAPELWEQQLELLGYLDKFDRDFVHARVIYQALRCVGNECVPYNNKSCMAKVRRIRSILSNESVKNALREAKRYTYRKTTRVELTLMRINAAWLIYIYLSAKKRKGG